MRSFRSRLAAALATGMVFSALMIAPAGADTWDQVPSIDVVRNRLSLTPEQESRLTPLFQERATQLRELRARIDQAPSRQEKRSLLRDARKQADGFNAQVESVLDVAQKKEWRELRAQTREKLKQAVEEQRSGS
jgi:hypothetical protein